MCDELAELLVLAVGQGVHGIHDNGLDALSGPASEHVVHDRHYVGKALSRTSAGRQYVRLPPLGGLQNPIALVAVQEKLLAAVVRIRLADPEDPRAFLVKDPLGNQIIDRGAGLERRVQLQQRLRPEPLSSEVAVNKLPDATVADLDEAAGIVPIVRDQTVPEIKTSMTNSDARYSRPPSPTD